MPPRSNQGLLLKAGGLLLVAIVAGVLVLQGFDIRAMLAQALSMIRSMGPVAFFTAMALAPMVGAPTLIFLLPAVPTFSERLGTPMVLVWGLVAITANFILTYALGRRLLRPPLAWLVGRLGYQIPVVEPGDVTSLIVIFRVTPGIPFFVQNYLLGLAAIPFGRFVTVSCIVTLPLAVAYMLFGDALLQGKGKMAVITLGLIIALTAGLQLVRRHYERRRSRHEKP